jgi:plastocyanin
MMFRSFALFSGLALLSSAAAHQWHHTVYKVQVSDSAGALVFNPPYIVSKHSVAFHHTVPLTASLFQNAAKGDTVEFTFASNNHTATESESIYDPCTPKYGGIDSGLYVLTFPCLSHLVF